MLPLTQSILWSLERPARRATVGARAAAAGNVAQDDDGLLVKAAERMTGPGQVELLYRLCEARMRGGARHVLLDLSGVREADTKLVACLVALRRIASACKLRLEVRSSDVVQAWLQVCCLECICRDPESATPHGR